MAKSKAIDWQGDAAVNGAELNSLPPKRIKEAVLSVRLDGPTIDWLEDAARRRGMGPSTLARMWILEQLAKEPVPPGGEWV